MLTCAILMQTATIALARNSRYYIPMRHVLHNFTFCVFLAIFALPCGKIANLVTMHSSSLAPLKPVKKKCLTAERLDANGESDDADILIITTENSTSANVTGADYEFYCLDVNIQICTPPPRA